MADYKSANYAKSVSRKLHEVLGGIDNNKVGEDILEIGK